MILAILDDDGRPLSHGNLGQKRSPYRSRKGSSPEAVSTASTPRAADLAGSPTTPPAASAHRAHNHNRSACSETYFSDIAKGLV